MRAVAFSNARVPPSTRILRAMVLATKKRAAKVVVRGSRPNALADLNPREKALFDRFPPAFEAFYRKHNGGECSNARAVPIPMTWQRGKEKRTTTLVSLDRFWSFMPKRIKNSLFCVSLNPHDYGSIHYWEWYWKYPWYLPFFEARVREAEKRTPPRGLDRDDMLDYATLVPVASSFEAFFEAIGA